MSEDEYESEQRRAIRKIFEDPGCLSQTFPLGSFTIPVSSTEILDPIIEAIDSVYATRMKYGRFLSNVTRLAEYLLSYSKEVLRKDQADKLVWFCRNNPFSVSIFDAVLDYYGEIPDLPQFDWLFISLTHYKGPKIIQLSERQSRALSLRVSQWHDTLFRALQWIQIDESAAFLENLLKQNISKTCYYRVFENNKIRLKKSWILEAIKLYPEAYLWLESFRGTTFQSDSEFYDTILIEYVSNYLSEKTFRKHFSKIQDSNTINKCLTHSNSSLRKFAKNHVKKLLEAEPNDLPDSF